jgi:hypothetical protein
MKFDKLSLGAAVKRLRGELGLGTTPGPSKSVASGKQKGYVVSA